MLPRKSIEIIAHRGASHDVPENTMAAVRRGWKELADAVEVDCRLTADGQIVAIHDADTARISAERWLVCRRTLEELKTLDVGSWRGLRWSGERMPTLGEVIQTIPEKKRLFIELKDAAETVKPLCRTLPESGKPLSQFVVIARDIPALIDVKLELPEVCAYVIADFPPVAGASLAPGLANLIKIARRQNLDGLNLRHDLPLDQMSAQMLAEDELAFHIWTVDCSERARELIAFGVDGIATNRPGWLREQLSPSTVSSRKGA